MDIPLHTASEPYQLVSYRMQRPSIRICQAARGGGAKDTAVALRRDGSRSLGLRFDEETINKTRPADGKKDRNSQHQHLFSISEKLPPPSSALVTVRTVCICFPAMVIYLYIICVCFC